MEHFADIIWHGRSLHEIAYHLIDIQNDYKKFYDEIDALKNTDHQKEIFKLRLELDNMGQELASARRLIMDQTIQISTLKTKYEQATGLRE